MKKIKFVLLALCLCLMLSGCNGFHLSSVDDLISPISLSGDDAAVQNAVNEYCKEGYSIKIPSNGDYTTSYIYYDLDNNGSDEAIAFYEPNNKLGTVDMAVLSKTDDSWKVVENITGNGADINRVDFCDVNNDGIDEIIVCWNVIANSATSNLSVYKSNVSKDKLSIKLVDDTILASDFICVDLNEDDYTEILVLTIGNASESPKAELYSFSNDKKNLIGETKLDSTINCFKSIISGKTDEGMCVYADAIKSDGESMVTELLYWSNYYDSVISPFYSYNTGRTSDTARNNLICCRDIDDDGAVEIPLDKSKSLPEGISVQSWVSYENTVLNHKNYSISCKKDGYLLIIPNSIYSKMKVEYDEDSRKLTVLSRKGKTEYFSITAVIKSDYDKQSYAGFTEIFSDSGFVYLAQVNDKSKIDLTTDTLKNMIKTY